MQHAKENRLIAKLKESVARYRDSNGTGNTLSSRPSTRLRELKDNQNDNLKHILAVFNRQRGRYRDFNDMCGETRYSDNKAKKNRGPIQGFEHYSNFNCLHRLLRSERMLARYRDLNGFLLCA